MVPVAFVLSAFCRRILGWRAASSMRTDLVLDVLEMAFWTRARAGVDYLTGLVAHHDAGRNTGRSATPNGSPRPAPHHRSAASATPATTPRRERDQPVRTEVIRARGPWRSLDDVEVEALEWVDWRRPRRLHSACCDLTPAEYERVNNRQHPVLEALV